MKKIVNMSKTKIKFNSKRKTNPEVSLTISLALKNKGWLNVANLVASSNRKYSKINLDQIQEQTKEGDTVVIIGKVLGVGEIKKKIRVCALGYSSSALEKMKKAKCEAVSILEEIKKNPKAEGIKLIK